MLELTRVKPEHADLVGVACLRIAAKMVGAVELQPTPRELCINCDNTFSEQVRAAKSTSFSDRGPRISQLHIPPITPCDMPYVSPICDICSWEC